MHSTTARILCSSLRTVLFLGTCCGGVQGFAVQHQLISLRRSDQLQGSSRTLCFAASAAFVASAPNHTTTSGSVVMDRPIVNSMEESLEAASLMVEQEALTEALEAAYVAPSSSSSVAEEVVSSMTTALPPLTSPVHTFASMWGCLEFLQKLEGSGSAQNNDEPQQQRRQRDWYVVKYYAQYCKVCQRASINYKKISHEYDPNVHFVRVDAGAWATTERLNELKELGITKFPFVQVYDHDSKCVASFSTGASHLFSRRVRDTLDLVLQRTPLEWRAFYQEFQPEIANNQRVRRQLLEQHHLEQQQQQP